MKTAALTLSILCAVATAAPISSIRRDGDINVLPDSHLDIENIGSDIHIIDVRKESDPIVDILNGGKIDVSKNVKDINIGQGIVPSTTKDLNARGKILNVADVLKDGTAAVDDNAEGINVARDNGIVEVLQNGEAIVQHNAEGINVARDGSGIVEVLQDGTATVSKNGNGINVARDNGAVEILQGGEALVQHNAEGINVARDGGAVVEVLENGEAIVEENVENISVL